MEEKLKRQKIQERDTLEYEDKQKIMLKSNERCCHCGKKAYIGYGATIDHFIPLSEGGTNRDINLVMLCDKCNSEKQNKIMHPRSYLKYLNEEPLAEIEAYTDSFVKSFEYLSRHNLLAYDEYDINVLPGHVSSKYKNRIKVTDSMMIRTKMKRATLSDTEKIVAYYTKYLKKYDLLNSEEAARVNIKFWMQFGVIYYVERNNDIVSMAVAIATKRCGRSEEFNLYVDGSLLINVFMYYDNVFSYTVTDEMISNLSAYVLRERDLPCIPVEVQFIRQDKAAYRLLKDYSIYPGNVKVFVRAHYIAHFHAADSSANENAEEKLKNFFDSFSQVYSEIKNWTEQNPSYKWMEWDIFEEFNPIGLKLNSTENGPKMTANS